VSHFAPRGAESGDHAAFACTTYNLTLLQQLFDKPGSTGAEIEIEIDNFNAACSTMSSFDSVKQPFVFLHLDFNIENTTTA
jgi:hypothetical protein